MGCGALVMFIGSQQVEIAPKTNYQRRCQLMVLRANRSKVSWESTDFIGNPVDQWTRDEDGHIRDKVLKNLENFMSPSDLRCQVLEDDDEQPIIEATQIEVKKALKALLTKQSDIMEVLYKAHEDYNARYFQGKLSVPLITMDKMSHLTLSSYVIGTDTSGLENHIRLNRSFIALNTETRILETLKHEMIHQYQDEVIYEKHDKFGILVHEGEKRPKDWHNKDFKSWALNVGILANGRKGYGNPAKMPEPKSYNRKFICKCIASNGYPMTIWSTREIKAVCSVCNSAYIELKKAGDTIPVGASDIEVKGQDAIEDKLKVKFKEFTKFKEKYSLSDKIKELKKSGTAYREGIYQKGHNAYLQGYHYWVAYEKITCDDQKPSAISTLPKRSDRVKRGAGRR